MLNINIDTADVLEALAKYPDNHFDGLFCDPPYGLKFMGKKWDYDVPSVEVWKACLRVLKPGAGLMAFGGSRTFHRMTVNIEDAGFEVRDVCMWVYATGFPKSLNISKAIAKAGGSADEVARWDGMGSAMKPAYEPIVLARKPLDGTVATNALKWGVGGLAIDACRIGSDGGTKRSGQAAYPTLPDGSEDRSQSWARTGHDIVALDAGRWPANAVFDESAGALLDEQSGVRPSTLTGRADPTVAHEHPADGEMTRESMFGNAKAGGKVYADNGGASRFFYCTKVSRKERERGCDHLPLKSAGEATGRQDDTDGLNSPRAGAGRTGGTRNVHPTLKPIALVEYFSKLILPPAREGEPRRLLVPFSGSGSEIIGAHRAGWEEIQGIERDPEYVAIAHARIADWLVDGE